MKKTHLPKRLVAAELINLAAENPSLFVDRCETAYRNRIEKAAEIILKSGCKIVMLTGPSATGKTTSANRLAECIRSKGVQATVLSLDDFYLGEGNYPKLPNGKEDYECLEALDIAQIHKCLKSLHKNGYCDAPLFDFNTEKPNGTHLVECGSGVAIVEGLHALNPELVKNMPDGSVFNIYASLREEYADADGIRILPSNGQRLLRRLVRDWQFRGHSPEYTLDVWKHVCESEDKYIKAFQNRAELWLDTSFSYEPCLWNYFLKQIKKPEEQQKHTPNAHFEELIVKYGTFTPISGEFVPQDSMLREFIGANTDKFRE